MNTVNRAWVLIVVAGVFETAFATALKLSDGFRHAGPTASFVVFAAASFFLLTRGVRVLPLGTAYAVWTGIGAAGTVLTGIVLFGEPLTLPRLLFLVLLIGSIAALRLIGDTGDRESVER